MPRIRRGRLVALEGPSSSGKSTAARGLAGPRAWHVVPEAFDRLSPRPSLEFTSPTELGHLEGRLLREEFRRSAEARRLQAHARDVLLDTAGFGPATYSLGVARRDPAYGATASRFVDALVDGLRSDRLAVPELVVVLDAPDPTLRRRVARSSGVRPRRWAARHRRVWKTERLLWTWLERRSPGSVRTVRSTGRPEDVLDRIGRALSRPTRPLRPSAVVDALRSLEQAVRRPAQEERLGRPSGRKRGPASL